MKLQFWGVRGYVPTPGAEYLRYGGNTCCALVCGAARGGKADAAAGPGDDDHLPGQ